ncbi:KAP family P-loop NTPase fold protein [Bifidobacterium kimbladii]|uniref:KAP NTPase domain-containing protein n=1 Tax=Bifidobacterium asteroides TaxID=1684 RepID=A0A0F4KUA4_9BIFI|nr:KAP family NTPase [Bifidobacterium asteroides]KJY49633.1 hypothetical protein JF69_09390 [Bifidobacterium asteroides]
MRENSIQHSSWLFDEPITDKSEDEYQRSEFTQNLADALLSSTEPHGLIIGINGPWGSGKTSLKNMLINDLKASEDTNGFHIIEFEPWMYSGSGQIVSLLFKQMAQTLSGKTNFLYRALLRLSTISNFWSPVVSALFNALLPGFSYTVNLIASFFDNIGNYLNPGNENFKVLTEQREKLRDNLNSTKTRIVVFIDDLDRLTDSEIAEMLRAVKAVGDLPYVTYVLLYDRDVVAKSLNKTCHNKGDEYLEKIIQVPIGLPEPSKEVVERMLTSEIESIIQVKRHDHAALPSSIAVSSSFEDIKRFCIAPFVNNLRDAIRLTNEFKIRYQVLKDDVEPGDLLGITSLEVFRPSLYKWIIGHKNLICSHYAPFTLPSRFPPETAISNLSDRVQELLENMNSSNGETGKQDSEAIKALFPFAKASASRNNDQKNVSLAYLDPYEADRHIFRPEHFDAYFRLSIEQDIMHENEYKKFLLYDALSPADLDKHHWDIFRSTVFVGKASKYLCNSNSNRAAEVIEFCLRLEEKFNDKDQGYMTLKLVLVILNTGEQYSNFASLLDAITRQLVDSESPLSLVVCEYLAYQFHVFLSPEAHKDQSEYQPHRVLTYLPELSLFDYVIRSGFQNNYLTSIYNKLSDRLKRWEFKPFEKSLYGSVMSGYAKFIPILFDSLDDQYKAFIVFSHMVNKAHFVIYTLNALVQNDDDNYVMNLPLLQQLVDADACQIAITELINDESYRGGKDALDFGPLAAYEVLLKSDMSTNSVSTKKVNHVLKEWENKL